MRKRSKYSLSHYKLLTMRMGHLVPVTWFDVLPGDSVQMATSALIRCAPLFAPVMHPVKVRIHHFYVPIRQIWEDVEEFMTGGEDGNYTCVPPFMTIDDTSSDESELLDYLGIAPYDYGGDAGTLDISALPIRAYHKIWNHYYRDQDLMTYVDVETANGDAGEDAVTSRTLNSVSWEKDYFTTARPTELKGDDVVLPLGDDAPIVDSGLLTNKLQFREYDSSFNMGNIIAEQTTGNLKVGTAPSSNSEVAFDTGNYDFTAVADLSGATPVSINDLRLAAAVQRYKEARNIYGSRYNEYIRHAFGVNVPSGMDDPVYLGGGRQVIQFSEVLQAGTDYDANTGVGQMAGHGIAALRSNRFRRFFSEHGIVMTMMSVIPKPIYATGLHRSWSRDTKEHYFQRELETIGEQAVLNKEVDARHDTPDGIFGYQRRYDEYRWHPSSIAGEFRSALNYWHLARIFAADPALNSSFVTAAPTTRIFADTSNDNLYCMLSHSVQARRVVNRFARPHLL